MDDEQTTLRVSCRAVSAKGIAAFFEQASLYGATSVTAVCGSQIFTAVFESEEKAKAFRDEYGSKVWH